MASQIGIVMTGSKDKVLQFSTKAGTLHMLSSQLKSAEIAPLIFFTFADWKKKKETILSDIQTKFKKVSLVVRSSCLGEDSESTSHAGAFKSILNVSIENLAIAIEEVFASYGKPAELDEVLVQPMLKNVIRSGVVFSHDPNTCSPYRVINWTEGSDTTLVTSGRGGRTWQKAASSSKSPPSGLESIIPLQEELSERFNQSPIDFEFAITLENKKETLWLLQVRPLVIKGTPVAPEHQKNLLNRISDKIARGMRPHPYLMGKRTVYGVMPDWNPAEIIGIRPKPLALSLYRELVTDSIWAYQRHNYGYRNLRSHPLMPHFYGLPYIDARLSFNSFIPASLNENLAGKLVDYYIDRLLEEPTLHDKVEFEIVFSCYTLDLAEKTKCLASKGFSEDEIKQISESLQSLTNNIIHPKTGLWHADSQKIEVLNKRREELLNSDADPIERVYWLLEDTKRYGTLPFAGLARAGFVAVQMLKSLVSVGILSETDYDSFMSSLTTVSGQLTRDKAMLDRTTFLARYGHLRPGTYDILSSRYDETPDLYFDWSSTNKHSTHNSKSFSLTLEQMKAIGKLLEEHGLHPDVVGLFDFLKSGIELREMSKFHFTRNLSDALSLMGSIGAEWGFSREDMAYCDVNTFKELYISAADPKELLANNIELGKKRYKETLSLSLPPLIVDPEDVMAFEWPELTPNFITQKEVAANVVDTGRLEKLSGAIVCIPNADPGFDWLFSYPIAGMITAWGGANSHMAIRSGELGIPAIIGTGELLYKRYSKAQKIHIDCAGKKVEILS